MVTTLITTEIEGLVEKVNDHGFRLAGREGWTNLSKYAEPRPQVPAEGQRVRCGLDKSGFARTVEVVGESATYTGGYRAAADAAVPAAHTGSCTPGDRDLRIVRMNALGHAVAVLASRGAVQVDDLLSVAAQLEAWVTR